MNLFEIIFTLLMKKNFDMAKNIRGFLENLFEYYFSNISVNVLFSLMIWNLSISVSTTLK